MNLYVACRAQAMQHKTTEADLPLVGAVRLQQDTQRGGRGRRGVLEMQNGAGMDGWKGGNGVAQQCESVPQGGQTCECL